jgi:hypothetical protein
MDIATDVSSLEDQFSNLNFVNKNSIYNVLQHDIDIIIKAYHEEKPSIFDYHTKLFTIHPKLKTTFFEIYPTERHLFKEIENYIYRQISTIFYLELCPLIDEYIEYVYNQK